jgi:hypothetical protein
VGCSGDKESVLVVWGGLIIFFEIFRGFKFGTGNKNVEDVGYVLP